MVPWVCLQYVIVVFPDHTQLRFSVSLLIVSLYSKDLMPPRNDEYECKICIVPRNGEFKRLNVPVNVNQ